MPLRSEVCMGTAGCQPPSNSETGQNISSTGPSPQPPALSSMPVPLEQEPGFQVPRGPFQPQPLRAQHPRLLSSCHQRCGSSGTGTTYPWLSGHGVTRTTVLVLTPVPMRPESFPLHTGQGCALAALLLPWGWQEGGRASSSLLAAPPHPARALREESRALRHEPRALKDTGDA